MVKLSELLSEGTNILSASCENPRLEAEVLLTSLLGKDRIYLTVHKNDCVDSGISSLFISHCKRRADGEPSAYITGVKEFMGLEFDITPHVLIPRPETELIAEYVISRYQSQKPDIIDICTGSGAIACAVAHFLPHATVTGIDISHEAIETAKKNAKKLGLDDRVRFVHADALREINLGKKFDAAVSNPPYIESAAIETLERDVKNFEPRLALDGGNDGLIFYRKIVDNIKSVLNPDGELVFEIGYNQGEALKSIMNNKFTTVTVTKDYSGLDRMVSGILRRA